MLFPKIIIVLLLVAIIASLFSGLYFLLHDPSRSRRLVRALTLRVALSIGLIAFIAIAYLLGWLHPHGIAG